MGDANAKLAKLSIMDDGFVDDDGDGSTPGGGRYAGGDTSLNATGWHAGSTVVYCSVLDDGDGSTAGERGTASDDTAATLLSCTLSMPA